MRFNIFKIEYDWYEGEHEETFLGKQAEQEEFEKDLIEARDFARSLIGKREDNGDHLRKGYSVECLPEYYKQIILFLLEKKGYAICYLDEEITYCVDDSDNGENIRLKKYKETTHSSEL